MTDAALIANRYIALWNETNADRRQALLVDSLDRGRYLH